MTFDKPGYCPACGNMCWRDIEYKKPFKGLFSAKQPAYLRATCRGCNYEAAWVPGSVTLTFDGYFSYICEPAEAAK